MVASTLRWECFSVFRRSAWFATAPASLTARARCERAYIGRSGHVASHISARPHFQGITNAPFGPFPFAHEVPKGSRWEGTLADTSPLLISSLTAACRECQSWLILQLRPCSPRCGLPPSHTGDSGGVDKG